MLNTWKWILIPAGMGLESGGCLKHSLRNPAEMGPESAEMGTESVEIGTECGGNGN